MDHFWCIIFQALHESQHPPEYLSMAHPVNIHKNCNYRHNAIWTQMTALLPSLRPALIDPGPDFLRPACIWSSRLLTAGNTGEVWWPIRLRGWPTCAITHYRRRCNSQKVDGIVKRPQMSSIWETLPKLPAVTCSCGPPTMKLHCPTLSR